LQGDVERKRSRQGSYLDTGPCWTPPINFTKQRDEYDLYVTRNSSSFLGFGVYSLERESASAAMGVVE